MKTTYPEDDFVFNPSTDPKERTEEEWDDEDKSDILREYKHGY